MTTTESIITDATPKPQPRLRHARFRPPQPGLRLAILAGLLLFLACPPVTLWPLAWVALAPLMIGVTRARSLRQALWRGYAFGWAFLGTVWYWTGLTLVAWTGSAIGWAGWVGLTLILAGFYALWGGAAWALAQRVTGGWRVAGLAAAWVVMEWARTLGSLTMPWAQLSYTQYHFLPILQIADITGAYGVSFLLALVNFALAECWLQRKASQFQRLRWLWGALTLASLVCLYGTARLMAADRGRPLPVAIMQGNFPLRETEETLSDEARTFVELTRRAAASSPPPALYVWSESAAPGDAVYKPGTRDLLRGLARTYQAPILTGSRIVDPQTDTETNASVFFAPDGSDPTFYRKQQLVPFGEFIPFRLLLPAFLSAAFHFFDKDVTRGAEATIFRFTDPQAGNAVLGPFICYESMYPNYPRAATRAGATLLVTQSNDSWFQSRAAMEQHLAAVVLRAIENRRDVIRSTTTGITCLIDSEGRIVAQAPVNTPYALTCTATLRDGKTLYTRFGDWFVALCVGLMALAWRGGYYKPPAALETQRHRGKTEAREGEEGED